MEEETEPAILAGMDDMAQAIAQRRLRRVRPSLAGRAPRITVGRG
jgi:hypothetical protein